LLIATAVFESDGISDLLDFSSAGPRTQVFLLGGEKVILVAGLAHDILAVEIRRNSMSKHRGRPCIAHPPRRAALRARTFLARLSVQARSSPPLNSISRTVQSQLSPWAPSAAETELPLRYPAGRPPGRKVVCPRSSYAGGAPGPASAGRFTIVSVGKDRADACRKGRTPWAPSEKQIRRCRVAWTEVGGPQRPIPPPQAPTIKSAPAMRRWLESCAANRRTNQY